VPDRNTRPTDFGPTLGVVSSDFANDALAMSMEKRRSSHRYFEMDQSVYFFKCRLDIKPLWGSPVTPANSSSAANTLSAYCVLK
jgi:hypothetical protein